MSKQKELRTFSTTTFVVEPIQDYSILEEHFRLERYIIPASLNFQAKKNPNIFSRVHNAFRNQLAYPYRKTARKPRSLERG